MKGRGTQEPRPDLFAQSLTLTLATSNDAMERNATYGFGANIRKEDPMRTSLRFAALAEAVIGLVLLCYPPVVVKLVFAAHIPAIGFTVSTIMSRIAGMGLIALGLACWPTGADGPRAGSRLSGPPLLGQLVNSTFIACYLGYIGYSVSSVGPLFWPVFLLSLVLALLAAWALLALRAR